MANDRRRGDGSRSADGIGLVLRGTSDGCSTLVKSGVYRYVELASCGNTPSLPGWMRWHRRSQIGVYRYVELASCGNTPSLPGCI